MTQKSKLLRNLKNNPGGLKYRDIEKILLMLGFEKIKTKSSHVKFKKENFDRDLVIPVHNNECKDFYKKQIYKQIKKLL